MPHSFPIKYDDNFLDKPPLALIPAAAIQEIGRCMGYGAEKYGVNNYKLGGGMDPDRLLSAALRHIYQHLDGEYVDEDSRLKHLAHAASNLCMAIDLLTERNNNAQTTYNWEPAMDCNT